jgi:hypothetical protein
MCVITDLSRYHELTVVKTKKIFEIVIQSAAIYWYVGLHFVHDFSHHFLLLSLLVILSMAFMAVSSNMSFITVAIVSQNFSVDPP